MITLRWAASVALRRVGSVGDFVAGNVFVALIYLSLSSGIVSGFAVRLAELLRAAYRRGFRYGHEEMLQRSTGGK